MKNSLPELYVFDRNIALFLGNHTPQFIHDTLDSFLLASLSTNLLFSHAADPDAWMRHYQTTLGKLCWTLNDSTHSETPKRDFSLLSTARAHCSKTFQPDELRTLYSALARLDTLSEDSPAIEAITKNQGGEVERLPIPQSKGTQTRSSNAQLQLIVVHENKTVTTLHLSFQTHSPLTRAFITQGVSGKTLTSEISVHYSTLYLQEDRYEHMRDKVIHKLGATRTEKVFSIAEGTTHSSPE